MKRRFQEGGAATKEKPRAEPKNTEKREPPAAIDSKSAPKLNRWQDVLLEDAQAAMGLRNKLAERFALGGQAPERFQGGGYSPGKYYEPQLTGSMPVPGQPGSFGASSDEDEDEDASTPAVPATTPAATSKLTTEPAPGSTTADIVKRIKALEKPRGFAAIESPWKRALLSGVMGGGMGAGGGLPGILTGGLLGAGITALMGRKKKAAGVDSAEPNAKGGPVKKAQGGPMQTSKAPRGRRLRFQVGGEVPPIAGLPGPPPGPIGPPPGSPAGRLPGPPPGPMPPPPLGLPPGGPPPGIPGGPPPGVAGGLPPAPPPAPALPPPGPPPGPPLAGPGVPAPLPQVAAPAAAMGAGLPAGNAAVLGRPRPGMKKGGAVKGKTVLTRRPKLPKISIAVVNKKNPVPTPAPYDDVEPPAPPSPLAKAAGGKIAAAAPIQKSEGGKCEEKKMAAGGVAKLRKGFPNTNAKPAKKFAQGGRVRGCGAATKGCTFAGIF